MVHHGGRRRAKEIRLGGAGNYDSLPGAGSRSTERSGSGRTGSARNNAIVVVDRDGDAASGAGCTGNERSAGSGNGTAPNRNGGVRLRAGRKSSVRTNPTARVQFAIFQS